MTDAETIKRLNMHAEACEAAAKEAREYPPYGLPHAFALWCAASFFRAMKEWKR